MSPFAAMTMLFLSADVEALRRTIELDVSLGFMTRAELISAAMSGDSEEERSQVSALVDEALRRHQAKQRSWKGRTDSERLTAAFERLNRRGLVAREYFGMTRTSGTGELKELLAKKPALEGFVFYTPQDLETVFDDKGVFLTLGAAKPGADALTSVAGIVVKALQQEGLAPEWDGVTRVWVPLTWNKRRKP